MHKDITAQTKPKKDEREEILKEIRQLENRQKILENKQRNEERKARTRISFRTSSRSSFFGFAWVVWSLCISLSPLAAPSSRA